MAGSRRAATSVLAALVFVGSTALGAESAAPTNERDELRRRYDRLLGRHADLLQEHGDLLRRLESAHAPTRLAVEDYLEARGVTGLTFTDRNLVPLDRVLARATLGAEVRFRYEFRDQLTDLDRSEEDFVDWTELRARLAFGYALKGGAEVDVELQALGRSGGILGFPPDVIATPPPGGWPGADHFLALEALEGVTLRRAEIRLPEFNLFGRLAHVPVTLVAGRQEIAFGSGFLLGDNDARGGLTWDALRLVAESGEGARVDLFAGRAAAGARAVAAHVAGPVEAESNPAVEIAGVRAEKKGLLPGTTSAVYFVHAAVGWIDRPAPWADVGPVSVSALGVEVVSDLTARARLRLDGALEWGERDGVAIDGAGALAAEFEIGSGGAESSGGLDLFDGTAFAFLAAYGHEDFVPLAQDSFDSWDGAGALSSRNTLLLGARISRKSPGGAEFGLSVTHARATDAAKPAGLLLRETSPGPGDHIGEVYSLFASFRLNGEGASGRGSSDTRLDVSYTRFEPGDYFASPADAADRFTVSLTVGF